MQTRTYTKHKRRNNTISLRDKDNPTYKNWAIAVDRFFSGYKKSKDELFKIISKEEEQNLIRKYKNDRDELNNQLVQHHIFLAINLASKFSAYTTDYNELLSAAMFGLVKAAMKFKPKMGNKFSTYAVCWVLKYVKECAFGNRYNKNIEAKSDIYLDSPEFTMDRDEDNYNYTTFSDKIEPTAAHMFGDISSPYEKIEKNEEIAKNARLIDKITKSVATSSLSERDKTVYEKMFIDGMESSDISEQMGISKHAIAKSRSRIATYISEKFSSISQSV